MQEFLLDAEEILHRLDALQFRGVKGTTGTQASFLELFDGDDEKVRELDPGSPADGFARAFRSRARPTPQARRPGARGAVGVAQSAAKFATDVRCCSTRRDAGAVRERSGGSSAMAYKRNPMRAERMTGLARFVIELEATPGTRGEQWLERTLDDSANRRLVLPKRSWRRRDPGAGNNVAQARGA